MISNNTEQTKVWDRYVTDHQSENSIVVIDKYRTTGKLVIWSNKIRVF